MDAKPTPVSTNGQGRGPGVSGSEVMSRPANRCGSNRTKLAPYLDAALDERFDDLAGRQIVYDLGRHDPPAAGLDHTFASGERGIAIAAGAQKIDGCDPVETHRIERLAVDLGLEHAMHPRKCRIVGKAHAGHLWEAAYALLDPAHAVLQRFQQVAAFEFQKHRRVAERQLCQNVALCQPSAG